MSADRESSSAQAWEGKPAAVRAPGADVGPAIAAEPSRRATKVASPLAIQFYISLLPWGATLRGDRDEELTMT